MVYVIGLPYPWLLRCLAAHVWHASPPYWTDSSKHFMHFSRELILQQAPDEASAKAAKGLLDVSKWQNLGATEHALWGECKGSGSKPYQVQIDLAAVAFKCSCPSRKFPCKHGLALALIRAEQSAAITASDLPAWVSEWLEGRQQRAEKQEQKKNAVSERKVADADEPAVSAKRLQRMGAGLDELERWLQDQVAQGLAALAGDESSLRTLAARMVDAQLPGVASRLRELSRVPGSGVVAGVDWSARLLGAFGRLQLMIDGYRQLASLPLPEQMDLTQALGLPQSKEDVASQGDGVTDQWRVLGQFVDEDERLWLRRVWLQGHVSGRVALLQDFAHGARRFDQAFLVDSVIVAELAFYPGAFPLRAMLLGAPTLTEPMALPPAPASAAFETIAQAVAANPWATPQPLCIEDGVPECDSSGQWQLRIPGEGRVPLRLADREGWTLCALAGGHRLRVFGEWHQGVEGSYLRPLTAWQDQALAWSAREAV